MLLVALALFPLCNAQTSYDQAPKSAREAAVLKARDGDTHGALRVLQDLLQRYPNDPHLLGDTVVIANWAGEDALAIQLYAHLQTPKDDVGVTEAAARSARNLHQFDRALQLYRRDQFLDPNRWQADLGEALVLVDKGEQADLATAAAILQPLLDSHGQNFDVLTGNSYLCLRKQDFACVLQMQERLLDLNLRPDQTRCEIAWALSRVGAESIAIDSYSALPCELQQTLTAAAGAEDVRWGDVVIGHDQPTEYRLAMHRLDQVIAASSPKDVVWRRAQFDRLQALSGLQRPREVVQNYEQLKQQGISVPDYALHFVADAYLALRQPDHAENLYRQLLQSEPQNGTLISSLAYAQFERERISEAFWTIDRGFADTPAWLRVTGLSEPEPNSMHERLGRQAAEMRGYAGMPAEEQKLLGFMLVLAPADVDLRRSMSKTYLARDWPLRALAEVKIADHYSQADELPSLAFIVINEGAGRLDTVDSLLPMLLAREGQSLDIHKFLVERAINRGWQIDASGDDDWSSGAYLGNSSQLQEVHAASPLLRNRWRILTHELFEHGNFAQGDAIRNQIGGGLSFGYARQSVSGEISADTGTAGSVVSAALSAELSFGDHWELSAQADSDNLDDVQLIAALNAIRARGGSLKLNWHANEARTVSAALQRLLFSDGNQRFIASGTWNEQLHNSPHLKIAASTQAYGSFNSRDQNRPYFNPAADFSLGPQATIDWLVWRRYDRSFRQQINAYAAPYWQKNYGTGAASAATCFERVQINKRLGFYFGMSWHSQPYDGANESYTSAQYGLTFGNQ